MTAPAFTVAPARALRNLLEAGLRRPPLALALIAAVALAVRVAAIALTSGYEPVTDALDYDRHARSVAAGDGFPESLIVAGGGPTAIRPPVYPYALGFVYLISGDSILAGRLFGALVGVATVALLYLLADRLWGRRAGLGSAAVAAVFPPLALLCLSLTTEALFVALTVAAVVAALKALEPGSHLGWAALTGLLCAAALLTRTNGTLLPILIVAVVAFSGAIPLRRRALTAALLVGVMALAMSPWVIRNHSAFGKFIPTSTQVGYGPAGLLHDGARELEGHRAVWGVPASTERYGYLYAGDRNEAEADQEARRLAFEYALDNPGFVAEAALLGLGRSLELVGALPRYEIADRRLLGFSARTSDLVKWSFWIGALFSIAGAFVLKRMPPAGRGPLWIWAIPLSMFLAGVWVIGLARYRAPLYPFMVPLIALALLAALDRITRSGPAADATAGVGHDQGQGPAAAT